MRFVKLSEILLACTCIMLVTGCNTESRDLRIQNNTQRQRIAQLDSERQAAKLELDQLKRQLESAQEKGGIEAESLQEKVAALEEALTKKNELIASMQEKLLYGSATLPVELTTKLEDLAKANDMITYDPNRGIVKFKSDLLFEKGSDKVALSAVEAVVIAGHTDDIPIEKPATRAKHPTNWYLSAHRAISVLDIMTDNKVVPERLSIRGFGEYRPFEPNIANKKGNPKNRRVEIYIVPEGT